VFEITPKQKLHNTEILMEINYQQQGDMLFLQIDALPETAVPANWLCPLEKGKVLQESETTGNYHRFLGNAAVDIYSAPEEGATPGATPITPNRGLYLVVRETTELFHGKHYDHEPALRGGGGHKSLTLLPGVYKVGVVEELDDMDTIKRVVD